MNSGKIVLKQVSSGENIILEEQKCDIDENSGHTHCISNQIDEAILNGLLDPAVENKTFEHILVWNQETKYYNFKIQI